MHVCVFLYIQNNYTQCTTHICSIMYSKRKLLFWMRLIAINHLTALLSPPLKLLFFSSDIT